jgi:hypothetical protein
MAEHTPSIYCQRGMMPAVLQQFFLNPFDLIDQMCEMPQLIERSNAVVTAIMHMCDM